MHKTKRNMHFSISWPGMQRGWAQPTVLLSKGITSFSSLAPAPSFAPRTPIQSDRGITA